MSFLIWILSCCVTLEKSRNLSRLEFFHFKRLFLDEKYLGINLLSLILTIPHVTYAGLQGMGAKIIFTCLSF